MPSFLIDVDEVLAEFAVEACKAVSVVLGRKWTFEDAPHDDWDMFRDLDRKTMMAVKEVMYTKGWCANLKVKPGAKELVGALKELCPGEVYALTSPMNSSFWHKERDGWLSHHFGIERSHIIHASAKHKVEGDFFLDDKPSSIRRWGEKWVRGQAMLWSTEHNRRLKGHDDIRVYGPDEVLAIVRRNRPQSILPPA